MPSAASEALVTGKGFISPTSRIAAIRAELLATPYSICLERPKLLEEFWSSEEGRRSAKEEHPLVHRALTLQYIFSHRQPRIYKDELIIGNMTSKRIAANYYIEGGSINIMEDIGRLRKRTIPLKLTGRETADLFRVGLRNVFKSWAPGRSSNPPAFLTFWISSGPNAIT